MSESREKRVWNVIVIGEPGAEHFKVLDRLPEDMKVSAIGYDLETLTEKAVNEADIMYYQKALVSANHVLSSLWPHLHSIKWIHTHTAGINHLLFPQLVESDVVMSNAKGVYSRALAEYAITACMHFAKDIPRMMASQKARQWDDFRVGELYGSTMGVVGYGDIGQACARFAKAFGMRVVALKRTESSKEDPLVDKMYGPSELHQLMADSDYVVMALPHTPATVNFVDEKALRAMKPTGVLVNLGRGANLDEEAIVRVLKDKAIKGAALDVFVKEPLPKDSELYGLDNVLISSHNCDNVEAADRNSTLFFVENAKHYAKHGAPISVVDKKAGY